MVQHSEAVPVPPPDDAIAGRLKTARETPGLRVTLFSRARGRVLILLCLMYFITYVDRVNISTAAPLIRQDLHLTKTDLGLALSAFAIPYAFFQIFGGWLGDRYGPRRVLGVVGFVWGLATAVTGFAVNLGSLFLARLFLGFGEGASFPTATHAMARWLPPDRRAFGQGITHSFARLGNAVTPLTVAALITAFSWRASFWIIGAISMLWVVVWIWYYRDRPDEHRGVSAVELDELPVEQRVAVKGPIPWRPLIRRVLPVTVVDFCYGWSLWVYLTWIPSFFHGSFGLNLKKFALFTTLVLAAGVIGDTAGGLLSDGLMRRTRNLGLSRRLVLVVGLLGSFAFVVPTLLVHRLFVVTVCLALAFFFLELTNSVLWAIPMDIAPQHAGTAGGLMNTGFGVAGILSPFMFGLLVDQTHSWQVPFAVSAALLFIGAALALRIDPATPLTMPPGLPARPNVVT